jgi:hydroxyacylglutathione hydrolase
MPQAITKVNLGGVNCYLVKAGSGYLLIDTGYANRRVNLDRKLSDAGCQPGNLKLIILTHGDVDHAGNGAHLRKKYGAKIAIHAADAGMVERGDMSLNRKTKPDKMSLIFKIMSRIFPLFIKTGKFDVFKPDLAIDEGFNLSAYGSEASVVHLPGHSKGSIGILTAGGDLFCGDLLYNMLGFNCIDDLSDYRNSIEKLKKLNIRMIHPGHGKPFSMERFRRKYR